MASYRVLRDGVEVATVTGATTYTDAPLINDTTYRYTLVAVDGHGNRSVSSAAVSATPHELEAPAPPTGLTATAGDRRVDLAWNANTEPDLAGYRVLRDGVQVATVSGTTYLDTGLVNDRTYRYTVVAVDTHGNRSAPSAAVAVTQHPVAGEVGLGVGVPGQVHPAVAGGGGQAGGRRRGLQIGRAHV